MTKVWQKSISGPVLEILQKHIVSDSIRPCCDLDHRCRRWGRGPGHTFPLKIFLGNCHKKFGHFSGKYHVKFGDSVNFSDKCLNNLGILIILGQTSDNNSGILLIFIQNFLGKMLPPKLTEPMTLTFDLVTTKT